jgi:hypothetical protein
MPKFLKQIAAPLPQTSIPGAIGSIFIPRDAKTGRSIPAQGKCRCGSSDNHIQQVGAEVFRICNNCKAVISSVTAGRNA